MKKYSSTSIFFAVLVSLSLVISCKKEISGSGNEYSNIQPTVSQKRGPGLPILWPDTVKVASPVSQKRGPGLPIIWPDTVKVASPVINF